MEGAHCTVVTRLSALRLQIGTNKNHVIIVLLILAEREGKTDDNGEADNGLACNRHHTVQ